MSASHFGLRGQNPFVGIERTDQLCFDPGKQVAGCPIGL
jgi:hypothetical protein